MTEFLPYGRQDITDEDVAAVADALRRPMITQGTLVDEFETAFAEAVGARHAIAFANGTGALHAAAAAAGLGSGDEMLTSAVSFVASANCALFVGARPHFEDIDRTGNLDVSAAADTLASDRLPALVAVSLAGLPVDLAPLQEARLRGTIVIEDACHALGGRRGETPVGGGDKADMTTFSLHPVKAMTTGEGGVVATQRDDLADTLRRFRTHGITRVAPESEDPLRGPWHYDVASLGFNYRLTDFQCALGLSQLRRLPEFIAERNRVAARYRDTLADVAGVDLPAEPSPRDLHAYHLFVVRFPEGARRRRQIADGLREVGIGTQLHYIPIYRHSLYRNLGYESQAERMPESERYYREALTLPLFPAMRDSDVDRVADELRRLLAEPVTPETVPT